MLDYGPEGYLKLPWGGELRFEAYSDEQPFCTYLRIVDTKGKEIAYWNIDEWKEDEGIVIGAIMGMAQKGPNIDYL